MSELWIGIKSADSPVGTGTKADPFNGFTTSRFDGILKDLQSQENCKIHLIRSGQPFRTALDHTWFPRNGWEINGHGSVLQLAPPASGKLTGVRGGSAIGNSGGNPVHGVYIHDLVVDGNWSELEPLADTLNGEKAFKTSAVYLYGSSNVLERVFAKQTYGSAANRLEHFALGLAASNVDETRNVIRYCRAKEPQGTWGSPLALHGYGFSQIIRNSEAYGNICMGVNNGLNPGFNTGGVNIAFCDGLDIYENLFIDCRGIVYSDTGTNNRIRVRDNSVVRGYGGLQIVNGLASHDNLEFVRNTLSIQNRDAKGHSYGINIVGNTVSNVVLALNGFRIDRSGKGVSDFYPVALRNVSGGMIVENILEDSASASYLMNCSDLSIRDNRTPTVPVRNLQDN